jgi:hypothetical protein
MSHFLSPERQATLTEKLTALGEQPDRIQFYIDRLTDDLETVDFEMTVHVQAVILCRDSGQTMQALAGLAILLTIMEEGMSRGLGENDFPKMLAATQDDLQNHYGLDEDDVIAMTNGKSTRTLQ